MAPPRSDRPDRTFSRLREICNCRPRPKRTSRAITHVILGFCVQESRLFFVIEASVETTKHDPTVRRQNKQASVEPLVRSDDHPTLVVYPGIVRVIVEKCDAAS